MPPVRTNTGSNRRKLDWRFVPNTGQLRRLHHHMVLVPWALLAFGGACCAPAWTSGTSIVLLWDPKTMVIAADSLTATNVPGTFLRTCKIHHAGTSVFAAAGLMTNQAVGYDILGIAGPVLRGTGTAGEKAVRIERAARRPLAAALSQLPEDVFREHHGRGSALQFVVASAQPGGPVFTAVLLGGVRTDAGGVEVAPAEVISCPGQTCRSVIVLGETDAISQFVKSNPRFEIPRSALQEVATAFVILEIRSVPSKVGPPVDVIRIDQSGIGWLVKKPECD